MEPQARVVFEQIKEQLAQDRVGEAVALLAQEHPADAADILMEFEEPELRLALLSRLDRGTVADVLGYLDPEDAADLISRLDPTIAAVALDETDPDVAADVLGEMEPEEAAQVLERMEDAERVGSLLLQPEESAAGVMTPDYVAVDGTRTVEEVLDYLRQVKPESEKVYSIFVIDRRQQLVGVVGLRDVVVSQPQALLQDIMNPEVVYVQAGTDQEEAARLMRHYDLVTLPVVDEERRLIGTITFDDAADVLEEEATEDIYHMAGLSSEERAFTPLRESILRRAPWLHVGLLAVFVLSGVVSLFEGAIAQLAALAVFMPIVARIGGDAGTQIIAVVVRGLAIGELTPRDAYRMLSRELPLALVNGLSLGILTGIIAAVWRGSFWLGVVIALAMVGNLVVASLVGVLAPLTLRRIGVDPALASGMVLTAFTDICGTFFYLGLGTLLLSRILGA